MLLSSHPDNRIIWKLWNEIIKSHNISTDKIKQDWLRSAARDETSVQKISVFSARAC